MKLFIFFVSLVYFVQSQVVVPGKCPDVPAIRLNEKSKWTGDWYILKTFDSRYNRGLRCLRERILKLDDKGVIGEYLSINETTNKPQKTPYNGTYTIDSSVADYTISMNVIDDLLYSHGKAVYLDVDDNVFITWSCGEQHNNSYRFTWVEARNKTLTKQARKKITDFYDRHNLSPQYLIDVNHENCDNEV